MQICDKCIDNYIGDGLGNKMGWIEYHHKSTQSSSHPLYFSVYTQFFRPNEIDA